MQIKAVIDDYKNTNKYHKTVILIKNIVGEK